MPLTLKEYNRRKTGSNPLYPVYYKPPYHFFPFFLLSGKLQGHPKKSFLFIFKISQNVIERFYKYLNIKITHKFHHVQRFIFDLNCTPS